MRILITGANGFLGSHLVEKALAKGHQVIAALRDGADRSNLTHLSGFQVLPISYRSKDEIIRSLQKLEPVDLIIHNAGMTKAFSLDPYVQTNVTLTQQLIEATQECGTLATNGNFAYVSSMAARGPVGHNGPASNYGRSKLMAEAAVKESGISYMIFRPTGIYGPRDVQFVPLIKAVKWGLYPSMTAVHQKITLINARDVAENVIECSRKYHHETVHLDDGHVYEHSDMKRILEGELGKKSINLRIAPSVVKGILVLSDGFDKLLKRTPALSQEQYCEISQDWNYDFSEERSRIPLTIDYPLQEGFKDAITYYKEKNLI